MRNPLSAPTSIAGFRWEFLVASWLAARARQTELRGHLEPTTNNDQRHAKPLLYLPTPKSYIMADDKFYRVLGVSKVRCGRRSSRTVAG